MTSLDNARRGWHPIAAAQDLVPRHVFHAQLFGRELAVWRADDGHINVWENRCLHRGVRLSIGINDGRELVCQYHGWRYANRTAGCTYIPAHPADAPARSVCNNRYPAIERHGLIWSSADDTARDPLFPQLPDAAGQVLRALPINASAEIIARWMTDYELLPAVETQDWWTSNESSEGMTLQDPHSHGFQLSATMNHSGQCIEFLLQPVDSARTVVHSLIFGQAAALSSNELRQHAQALACVRELAEADQLSQPEPEAWEALVKPVSASLSRMPTGNLGSQATQRVQVARHYDAAAGVKAVELTSIGESLITFQPGAHIDVHLPNGLIRQYSLTNAPGQTDRYNIAVKRDADSAGGSACVHDVLRVGDVIAVSPPRNNFPLRRDAVHTLLLAGGIGITPLLAMAQALAHSALPFHLHCFVRDESEQVHRDLLDKLASSVTWHVGLTPQETGACMGELLHDYQEAHHVYICGPGGMLDAARQTANTAGWPDDAVHFEYFRNALDIDDSSSFDVSLARSGLTLTVPAGRSVLEVLRENGIQLPSSCEQGACGTCRVAVIDGQPRHQDVYLSDSEKARNDCMMTCVSRAASNTLTLDI